MIWLETEDGDFINLERVNVIRRYDSPRGYEKPYCLKFSIGTWALHTMAFVTHEEREKKLDWIRNHGKTES